MLFRLLTLAILVQQQAAAPTFKETVLKDFGAWDLNQDGRLVQLEVDTCALDPQFHGPDAAALAALHSWLAAGPDPLPELTKEWFEANKPVRFKAEKGLPPAEAKKQRKEYFAAPGSLQSSFAAGLQRLNRQGKDVLFDENGPSLDEIRQGSLGDCFVLAPLGAMVHRDPDSIKSMVKDSGNGYTVTFGDGQKVSVSPLTDSELAMGGSSTKEGRWVRVIEKAFGSRKIGEGETKIARDSMNGGSTITAGKAFTGHKFTAVSLVGDFKKEVPDESHEVKMKQVRERLPGAIEQKLLVLAGTAQREMPKSISPNHAYAILGFDLDEDTITIWNPHGNDFLLKGKPGFENGYKIEDGVFSMPLKEFVRTFSRIMFESVD